MTKHLSGTGREGERGRESCSVDNSDKWLVNSFVGKVLKGPLTREIMAGVNKRQAKQTDAHKSLNKPAQVLNCELSSRSYCASPNCGGVAQMGNEANHINYTQVHPLLACSHLTTTSHHKQHQKHSLISCAFFAIFPNLSAFFCFWESLFFFHQSLKFCQSLDFCQNYFKTGFLIIQQNFQPFLSNLIIFGGAD